jgi:predicted house-cleaning noncanonical NTP pyrophosphatase (MazG superfamily)
MKTYRKLVRDGIPDIIRQSGRRCETATLDDELYRRALLDKLVEEASEAAAAGAADFLTELADLQEVIDSLLVAFSIDPEALQLEKHRRRKERGGFDGKVELVSVTESTE